MNRDEIWEHQDGSHWRILAVDLSDPRPIVAVTSNKMGLDQVGTFSRDEFTRQVRQPREFVLHLGIDGQIIYTDVVTPIVVETIRVREVLE